MAIVTELLTHSYKPYKYVITYNFSQDHFELLFNKICSHCGWNNNPDVLWFKYALRKLFIRNSIDPSKAGNCTHFDFSLCASNGIFEILFKRKDGSSTQKDIQPDHEATEIERTLIMIDNLTQMIYLIKFFITSQGSFSDQHFQSFSAVNVKKHYS